MRPIEWAWRDRLPLGALSVLVGEEGVGKGTLLAWLIARLTRGELDGDLYGGPVPVLLVGDEDGVGDVWKPRLMAAGADLDLVVDLPASDSHGLLEVRRDLDELRRIVRDDGFRVVVFDALLDNLPDDTDPGKTRSVRGALRPLGRVAREDGFTALGSLHTNKGAGVSLRDKMADSHQFLALARSGLLLAAHPEDAERRVLARGKGNLARLPRAVEFSIRGTTIQVDGHELDMPLACEFAESDLTVASLLGGSAGADDALALTEACEFLSTVLADGPLATAEVNRLREEAGISDKTLKRARRDLGVRAFKDGAKWAMSLTTQNDGPDGPVGPVDSPVKGAKWANSATVSKGATVGPVDGWTA